MSIITRLWRSGKSILRPAIAARASRVLSQIRACSSFASTFANARYVSSLSLMLLTDFSPAIAPRKSELCRIFAPSIKPRSSTSIWALNAWIAAVTSPSLTSSFLDFTAFSSVSRVFLASAAISSIAAKSSSMLDVCASASRFASSSRVSMSLHHLTVFSAAAKSSSVCSSVLIPRNTSTARDLNAGRFDDDTDPTISICSDGSASGDTPTTAAILRSISCHSARSFPNCAQPAKIRAIKSLSGITHR